MGNFRRKFQTTRSRAATGILLLSMVLVPASFAQGRSALSGKVLDSQGDLPLDGRSAAQLAEETPGVILDPVDNADQGTPKTFPVALTVSVNAARSADTNFMFDGGNNIDEYFSVNRPFPFSDQTPGVQHTNKQL